jgi:hypothetical protein
MSITKSVVLLLLLSLVPARTARAESDAQSSLAMDVAPLGRWEDERYAKQQRLLSGLWAFATLNYLYCDVIGLMDSKMLKQYSEGVVDGVTINENFLLGATILMQVPLSMVFLSTALPPRASRIANIAAGALMTTVQTATLFIGEPTKYYLFSSAVEIATTSFITGYAIFAMKPSNVLPTVEANKDSVALKVRFRF